VSHLNGSGILLHHVHQGVVQGQGCDTFCLMANTNEDLPHLKNKTWIDYQLSTTEWRLIKQVHDCLKVCSLKSLLFHETGLEFDRWLLHTIMNSLMRSWQHVQECCQCWSSLYPSGKTCSPIQNIYPFIVHLRLVLLYWRSITGGLMTLMHTSLPMVCLPFTSLMVSAIFAHIVESS
jgi:hypothetical protein